MKLPRFVRRPVHMLPMMCLLLTQCVSDQRGFPPTYGIQNFDRVNSQVFRGAQPTHQALLELKRQGVRTILNLRGDDEAWPAEESNARAAGLAYLHVPLNGVKGPDAEVMGRILAVLEGRDSEHPLPVFVHCHYGCERTGTVIACYRMIHDHWTAKDALREADIFGLARVDFPLRHYIRTFLERQ